jgi:hypothetical protein
LDATLVAFPMTRIVGKLFLSPDGPGPSLPTQRLPHLLRLLIMYQLIPIRASPTGHYFFGKRACPLRGGAGIHACVKGSPKFPFLTAVGPRAAKQARFPVEDIVERSRAIHGDPPSPERGRLIVARRFNGGNWKKTFFLAPQARAQPSGARLPELVPAWAAQENSMKRLARSLVCENALVLSCMWITH